MRDYQKLLESIAETSARQIQRTLGTRLDADIDGAGISQALERLRARFLRLTQSGRIRREVERVLRRVAEVNEEDLLRILPISALGRTPQIQSILDAALRANIDLITSIPLQQLDQVQDLVRTAATTGMRVETLRDRIQERYNVTRGRAQLIARDQVLKANSELTQARHREAGIDRYVWSTSRDERVRDMHSELDGQEFSWSDPPVTNEAGDRNHPGEDYQCRCIALPVILET